MNAKIKHNDNGFFNLAGRIELDNIGSLLTDGQIQFTGHSTVVIDLSDADCANTAGLALLLEWASWCRAQAIKLQYKNPHTKLHQIVKINDLEQVLSFSG